MMCYRFTGGFALLLLICASSVATAQTSYPCSAESSLRSTQGTTPIQPAFENSTSSTVSIYWLNYSGQRVFYFTVAPGQTQPFATFLTHPWIAIDPAGKCLGIYIFTASGQTAVVTSSQGNLQALPSSLSFAANAGAAPVSLSFTISAATQQSLSFAIAVDGGQTGAPAPPWISVGPTGGSTPGLITVVVDPGPLSAGSYAARIVITDPNDASQPPVYVTVSVTVTSAQPQLGVAPASLSFRSSLQTPGEFEQTIVVQNAGGGGTESFSVSEPTPIPWLESVMPSNGQATPNKPAFVQVRINTKGLGTGGYKGILHFSSADSSIDVPISLFVASPGPILGVDQTGLLYTYRQGQGLQTPQKIRVFNLGDAISSVSFTADVANNVPWLSLSPASGTATAAQPGVVTATINTQALGLAAGNYYGLIRISDPNSQGSPQYVTVVLNVNANNSPPQPDPFPRGLVFVGTAGGGAPPAQPVTVYTSSAAPINFQASASANAGYKSSDGSAFLTVSPMASTLATESPAVLSVGAILTKLNAGVYQGSINLVIGMVVRGVNVTVIVLPAGSSIASKETEPFAASCSPTRVVLTQTGLPNGFSIPGGFPATLSVKMNDDCGNPITNGSAVASFSNGDPALSLQSDTTTGTYSATWQPGAAAAQTTVTVRATDSALTPGTTQITGLITPNQAPVLAPHGTVNNFNAGGGLSPGVVAAVFGSGLAAKAASPGVVPLPTAFEGTSVVVGSIIAPLFFVSGGQVNVQIPTELKPGQYRIIASVNGALTLPDTVDINPVEPGIVAFSDGHTIAQHSDFSLVNAAHPAKPGEAIVIYLAGMGATNPPVASGQPAPSKEPLARVTVPPVVTVGGQNAKVFFAGLTPGGIGLYQINFQVPASARSGDLELVVTQSGVAGNTTKLTVGQ